MSANAVDPEIGVQRGFLQNQGVRRTSGETVSTHVIPALQIGGHLELVNTARERAPGQFGALLSLVEGDLQDIGSILGIRPGQELIPVADAVLVAVDRR